MSVWKRLDQWREGQKCLGIVIATLCVLSNNYNDLICTCAHLAAIIFHSIVCHCASVYVQYSMCVCVLVSVISATNLVPKGHPETKYCNTLTPLCYSFAVFLSCTLSLCPQPPHPQPCCCFPPPNMPCLLLSLLFPTTHSFQSCLCPQDNFFLSLSFFFTLPLFHFNSPYIFLLPNMLALAVCVLMLTQHLSFLVSLPLIRY